MSRLNNKLWNFIFGALTVPSVVYFTLHTLIPLSFGSQIRLQFFHEFRRQTFRFFITAGAAVERFGFENEFAILIQNAVAEVQPHAFSERQPDFNRQHIVVTRGKFGAFAAWPLI